MKAVDYFFIVSVVFFTVVVTASICTSAEVFDEEHVYKLSEETMHDMFSNPTKYDPVFRQIMKSDQMYREICLELGSEIKDMSEEQYYRYNDCRKYFREIVGISLDDAVDLRNHQFNMTKEPQDHK